MLHTYQNATYNFHSSSKYWNTNTNFKTQLDLCTEVFVCLLDIHRHWVYLVSLSQLLFNEMRYCFVFFFFSPPDVMMPFSKERWKGMQIWIPSAKSKCKTTSLMYNSWRQPKSHTKIKWVFPAFPTNNYHWITKTSNGNQDFAHVYVALHKVARDARPMCIAFKR